MISKRICSLRPWSCRALHFGLETILPPPLKKLYFCHFCDTRCVDIYCSGTLFAFFSYFEFIYPFNLHFSLFFLDIGFSSGLSPFFLLLFVLLLSEDIGPYPSVVLDITISVAEPGHFDRYTVPVQVPTSYFPPYGFGSGTDSLHNFKKI